MGSKGTALGRVRPGRRGSARSGRTARNERRDRVERRAGDAAVTLHYRRAAVAACIHLTAIVFAVSHDEVLRKGRGSTVVARARQVAIYLSHVVFSIPQSDVAEAFGRERTTVIWACHRVEDDREDKEFDLVVSQMERMLAAVRAGLESCAARGGRPSFEAAMGAVG